MTRLIRRLFAGLAEVFRPTWPVDPDPGSTAADTAARTQWVRDHMHPKGGGEP